MMKKRKRMTGKSGMTRREFIVTAGAATGAAMVTASMGPFVHTTMAKGKTLRVCSLVVPTRTLKERPL